MLEDIAAHLAAHDAGTWRPDGTAYPRGTHGIYLWEVPDAAGLITTLSLYDGPESDERNGDEWPRLQVRIKGTTDPRTSTGAHTLALDALRALRGAVLSDGRTVQDVYPLASAPTSLGQDTGGRWAFARNYQLHVISG